MKYVYYLRTGPVSVSDNAKNKPEGMVQYVEMYVRSQWLVRITCCCGHNKQQQKSSVPY